MLQYLYIYYYVLGSIVLTIFLRTRYFLSLIVLFEGATVSLFMIALIIGGFYNIFYIPAIALLMLMFSGLELAIALLLFNINV